MADGFERLLMRNLANGKRSIAPGGLGVNGLSQSQTNTDATGKLLPNANFSQRGPAQGQPQSLQHGQPSTPDFYQHDANANLLQHQTASPPPFAHPSGANYDPFAISPH